MTDKPTVTTNKGVSASGKPSVSKTENEGSIPSAFANPQTTIDIALEGIKNAKPIVTNVTKEYQEQFNALLQLFINQIECDVTRENLENAFIRFRDGWHG